MNQIKNLIKKKFSVEIQNQRRKQMNIYNPRLEDFNKKSKNQGDKDIDE